MENEPQIHNGNMLNAMNEAVDILISHSEETLYDVMGRGLWPVADAAAVDRIAIYKVIDDKEMILTQIYRWDRWEGGSLPIDETMRAVPKIEAVVNWMTVLSQNTCLHGRAGEFNNQEGMMLNPHQVKTYLLAPVFTHGRFWGIVTYYDCTNERDFDEDTVAFLRSVARLCSSSFIREEQTHSAKDAEERVQLMLNATPLCCELWGSNMRIIDCNEETIKFFGSDKQDILNGIFSFSPKFQPCGMLSTEKAAGYVEKVLDSGPITVEWMHVISDGTLVPTEVTIVPVKYKDDQIIAKYTRDLREHKKMLSEREHREGLMDSLNKAAMTFLSQSSKSFEDMMSDGVGLITDIIHLDRLSIWHNVRKPDGLYASQVYRWDRESGGTTTPTPGLESLSYTNLLPHWETLMKSNDVINGPVSTLPPRDAAVLQAFGVISVFIAPVFSENHFWGFVLFEDREDERIFDDDCAQFLRSAAYLCANTVIKADIEHQLAARLKQQEVMSDLSAGLIASGDATELVSDALGKLGRYCEVSIVLVFYADYETRNAGLAYQWVDESASLKMADMDLFDVIGDAFPLTMPENGEVPKIVCHNTAENQHSAFRKLYEVDIHAIICVPIYVEGRLWGIMSVEQCHRQRNWKKSEEEFILMAVSTISGAIVRDIYNNKIKDAYDQATSANQAKSDFLTSMSHEMRTPMNAVVGMTAIGKNTHDVERKNYALNKIEDAAAHLLGVINDVLDMSKIEANRLELSPTEFSLERVLRKVVSVIQYRIDEKQQHLSIDVEKKVPHFLIGDDQRITQVLTNLLSNAVKFTREGGEIRLDISLLSETNGVCELRVEVIDNGIGIAPENHERIFQAFTQAESGTSREFGGTGLGLVITKRIVELMDGKIWVESELGKGSRFIFTIKTLRGNQCIHSLLDPGVSLETMRILVVDDVKETRDFFTDLFHMLNIKCDVACDGPEALDIIKERGHYDVYFIDWRMPEMDGIELTKRIKSSSTEKQAVAVMISSVDWALIKNEAIAAGVDQYMLKPLFSSTVIDCINDLINLSKPLQEDELHNRFLGKKILLAEDIEINREILILLLESTGVTIDCAENGLEALQMIEKAPDYYDLILMDVQMPQMDGLEATRRIRALEIESASEIPIVAMTAHVFKDDIELCLAAGMNAHLGKPVEIHDLMEALETYL